MNAIHPKKQAPIRELQRQQRRSGKYYLLGLMVLLLIVSVLSLCTGDRWVWPSYWFVPDNELFIWHLRFPRILAVIIVGASLAMAGAVMQALFDNPLAEPGLLGVSNGSGMAMALCILLGQGVSPIWLQGVFAIIGALFITFLLLGFTLHCNISNARLLLIGVALSMICGAVMTWAIYFSSDLDLRQLLYWLMGGFSGVDWQHCWLMLSLWPVVGWLCWQGNILNVLALGEGQARQLGLPLRFWRNLLVLMVGWIVGVSVALAGVISFVGLLVPHILRLQGLTDHRVLLSGCALAGAASLLLADMLARVAMHSAELPIGVVTASIGAPLFIWALMTGARL